MMEFQAFAEVPRRPRKPQLLRMTVWNFGSYDTRQLQEATNRGLTDGPSL